MSELITIEKFSVEIQTATAVLEENKTSVQRATDYGNSLLVNFEKNGVNDKTYQSGSEYLMKIRKTVQTMNEKRKPLTQFLAEISKQFTSLENELAATGETVPAKIKAKLDEYAAEIARKQREQEIEAENKRKKAIQITECEGEIRTRINQMFNSFADDCINEIETNWRNISLDDFDNVSANIMSASSQLIMSDLANLRLPYFTLITSAEVSEIANKIKIESLPELNHRLTRSIESTKDSIIEQFDVRFDELHKIAEAKGAEAVRLKKEAELAEQKRLAEQKARIEEDQKAAAEAVQHQKIASNINNLFESTTSNENNVKVKEITEIHLTNPAGWIELVLFYFEKEGKTLSADKLEKKFGFAKKFAEAHYMKTDEKITSKFLNYIETAKSK